MKNWMKKGWKQLDSLSERLLGAVSEVHSKVATVYYWGHGKLKCMRLAFLFNGVLLQSAMKQQKNIQDQKKFTRKTSCKTSACKLHRGGCRHVLVEIITDKLAQDLNRKRCMLTHIYQYSWIWHRDTLRFRRSLLLSKRFQWLCRLTSPSLIPR